MHRSGRSTCSPADSRPPGAVASTLGYANVSLVQGILMLGCKVRMLRDICRFAGTSHPPLSAKGGAACAATRLRSCPAAGTTPGSPGLSTPRATATPQRAAQGPVRAPRRRTTARGTVAAGAPAGMFTAAASATGAATPTRAHVTMMPGSATHRCGVPSYPWHHLHLQP